MTKTKLLSISQVAQVTGLSYYLSRRMVLNGTFPCVMLGSRRRINSIWVERWLAQSNPELPAVPLVRAAQ